MLWGQDDVIADQFHALPYQLAHAVVRLVTLHGKIFAETKAEYERQKDSDVNELKAKTTKLRTEYESLFDVVRFSVLNRRTGCVATSDWMSRYIKVGADGSPQLKNVSSKAAAWVISLKIKIEGNGVKLWLQPSVGKSFRRVRCFSLLDGVSNEKLSSLVAGYEHILQNLEGGENDDGCEP